MRLAQVVMPESARRSGALAAIGGMLWIPHGVFEMLKPWGADTVYHDDRGYELIVDTSLFVLYSLPGALALLFTALAFPAVLATLRLRPGRSGTIALVLTLVAIGLGVICLLGVLAQFDPMFTAARIFGSLALGSATFLTGVAVRARGDSPGWATGLLALGATGLLLLPLWPLIHAVQWVPESAGAVFIALFGLGWVLLGSRLWASRR